MTDSVQALSDTPRLLIDGDIVAYRCAAVAEKTKYAVDGFSSIGYFDTAKAANEAAAVERDKHPGYDDVWVWSRKDLQPLSYAINAADTTLDSIIKRFPKGTQQVYLSGERNFRDNVWVTKKYKGNRDTPKPTHLKGVREHLISRWDAVVSQNQEADDDIGIDSRFGETIVVSTDKDLDQIPGWHHNWVSEETYFVGEGDAQQFFWEQVISGDATDNIPGLPGYGPKKARAYLDETANHQGADDATYHDAVYDLFKKEGFAYEYFHEMVTLIKILREKR